MEKSLIDINWPDAVFISGTGTDVGKSFATGWLARELRNAGFNCITQKLVQTGNVGSSEDIELHRKIMQSGLFPEDSDHTTAPLIFSYPSSPHLAARIDRRDIDPSVISRATSALESKYFPVLIEGAGGLMVPLRDDYLTIDYVKDAGLPAIIVVSGQLGSINHALMTMVTLNAYGIKLFGVIYNPYFDNDGIISQETRPYLRNWVSKNYPNAIWLDMPVLHLD